MRRLLVIAMLLVACAQEKPEAREDTRTTPPTTPPPSAEDAQKIIQSSMEFGEFEFTEAAYSMPVAHAAMNDPARAAARDLASAGWVSIDGTGDVALTDKARTDKRFILRPNGILDIVPLAKKEMGVVEAVRANPDGTVSADFTWRWIANEVGSAFLRNKYEGTHKATATLMHDGTQWTVLQMKPR